MGSDREERNRVLGMPWGPGPTGPHSGQGEEQQHVLGFPADWFGAVDGDWLRSLAHPIRGYKRWARRRRLGIYAPEDDDEPQPPGR